MSTSRLLRLVLAAGLIAASVSTAEAGKNRDPRFVNPSKPEGKTNRAPRLPQASPSRASSPRAQAPQGGSSRNGGFAASQNSSTRGSFSGGNSRSGGGSRQNYAGSNSQGRNYYGGDKNYGGPKNYGGSKSNNYHSGKYYGSGKAYSRPPTYWPRYTPGNYKPYCAPSSGVSVSIGVGYSSYGSYGSYIGGSYSSGARCYPARPYYPARPWGYGYNRWAYGWGCGPSYYYPPNPFYCTPASSVVFVGYPYSYGGTYYNSLGATIPTTVYEVQAQPTSSAYRDWQQSTSQTSGIDAVVLPARPTPETDSAQQWAPTGRQVEAVRQGWTLVSEGQAREAVAVFAVECEMDGKYAPSKVGYAVASELAGEAAAARWGMRRAFASPAPGIAYLPSVQGLTGILNTLSGSLWREMAGRDASPDDWFFLASIDYLRHDLGSARRAAQQAINLGDDSPSIANLMALIRTEEAG